MTSYLKSILVYVFKSQISYNLNILDIKHFKHTKKVPDSKQVFFFKFDKQFDQNQYLQDLQN